MERKDYILSDWTKCEVERKDQELHELTRVKTVNNIAAI